MGYDIIYGKQFIKISENEVVPFIEIGSSNCYDISPNGRERRERSYNSINIGKPYVTLNDIMVYCKKTYDELWFEQEERKEVGRDIPNEIDFKNNFGYYLCWSLDGTSGCKGSYNKFKSLFTDGFKKAMSVEELIENGVSIFVHTSNYAENQLKEAKLEPIYFYPKTSEELKICLDENYSIMKASGISLYISSNSDYGFKKIRRNRLLQKKSKEPILIEVTKGYVMKLVEYDSYILTYPRRHKKYITPYIESANVFYNEAQGKRAVKAHNSKTYIHKIELVEIKLDTPKMVKKV